MKERNYFCIEEKLHSLNDYITACRTNPHCGAKMKKESEEIVKHYIREAIINGTLHKVTDKVSVYFKFVDGNSRRDIDNISSFGHKVILDALVQEGILPNDNRDWIGGLRDEFAVEKGKYYIEVELIKICD